MKRILGILLSLIMLCLLVPGTVFAEPTDAAEGEGQQEQGASGEQTTTETTEQPGQEPVKTEEPDARSEEHTSELQSRI